MYTFSLSLCLALDIYIYGYKYTPIAQSARVAPRCLAPPPVPGQPRTPHLPPPPLAAALLANSRLLVRG